MKWNTFKEALHFSRVHTAVMWTWNKFLVCAYETQNKGWRWKTIWQLMTYNDRELRKWKEGWDLWESCLVPVLIPPSSAQRDPDLRFTLSWKGEGNVSQGTECWSRCQKTWALFSPLLGACLPSASQTFLNFSTQKTKIMILTFIKVFRRTECAI